MKINGFPDPSLLYDRGIGLRSVISHWSGVARGALWAVLVVVLFFAADGFMFRTGWYDVYLEPNSSAGLLESHLYWLNNAQVPQVPQVLVVGDSRVAEGFAPRLAASALGHRLHFWNFGVAGTSPRVWYYALRAADPTGHRFAAIVIALDHYSDEDGIENLADRVIDQNFLVMRLGFSDCPGFAGSMESMANRHRALAGCLFRGMMLRSDLQTFLWGPEDRIKRTEDWLGNGLNYINDYGGKSETLTGLSADWSHHTISFPNGLSDRVRAEVTRSLFPEPVPQTGELTYYRQRWLGAILDLYKDSTTHVIFLQLPRAPLPKPMSTIPAAFLDSALRRPHVSSLPAGLFADLERPEFFADGLHLNRDGRPAFTTRIAADVDSILSASSPISERGR
jgi:hypothetical protein